MSKVMYYSKDWMVYVKQPFGGQQVINYLGRYTHRTAISNDRILKVSGTEVTFLWKDYSNNYAHKTTTLKGEGFLALFAQHILPPGFTRIRHYGFLFQRFQNEIFGTYTKAFKYFGP